MSVGCFVVEVIESIELQPKGTALVSLIYKKSTREVEKTICRVAIVPYAHGEDDEFTVKAKAERLVSDRHPETNDFILSGWYMEMKG